GGDPFPVLGGLHRRPFSAGPRADHDEIEVIVFHAVYSQDYKSQPNRTCSMLLAIIHSSQFSCSSESSISALDALSSGDTIRRQPSSRNDCASAKRIQYSPVPNFGTPDSPADVMK